MARRSTPRAPDATTVLLVRHGQTPSTGTLIPGRAKGLHLSDTGMAQAEVVAERVALFGDVGAVYASPLERTRETAKPIARALGLRVNTASGLIDCETGEWTGRALRELSKLSEWDVVQRHPSGFRFPGGESFTEMQTRMTTMLMRLVAAHPGETIVAVSHADPIKAAVAHALGAPLDLFQRIVVSPCSISVVRYRATGPTVVTVNSTDDARAIADRS